ncbi:MAG: hypothetical protein KY442_07970 [Proteobacteria bacterium]|nr:hypothetical protein [Pseudomonadota bacterium]
MCDEFQRAGFVIERLVEPLPVEEMAQRFPDTHAQLMQAPAFVTFRLLPRHAMMTADGEITAEHERP